MVGNLWFARFRIMSFRMVRIWMGVKNTSSSSSFSSLNCCWCRVMSDSGDEDDEEEVANDDGFCTCRGNTVKNPLTRFTFSSENIFAIAAIVVLTNRNNVQHLCGVRCLNVVLMLYFQLNIAFTVWKYEWYLKNHRCNCAHHKIYMFAKCTKVVYWWCSWHLTRDSFWGRMCRRKIELSYSALTNIYRTNP